MLQRILEHEVMDTPEDARDYDAMDHAAVNAAFCDDFLALGPPPACIVDFGTGTALIPIALCERAAGFSVVAIELAENMLALARDNVTRAKLGERILFEKADAKGTRFEDASFGAVISNSIVHHIPEPGQLFAEMWRVAARGAVLFVRDLHRPNSEAEVDRLVALYTGEPPRDAALVASFERQRALFRDSLCASLTVAEIAAMVAPLGIPAAAVTMTSDRHWTLAWRKS
ncbi:class I SAM-dependent methyltransferase [Nannocystis radixulma]|uniref:Class I SAM-dependent methyltransferase n=1 Tax=Nannocystis radixulma TaxID=2995305 RepID=A0ABT5BNH1_9BACT|nr:class I SAM-dependent methyltransferase [Nannocystis radixulma]MDC0675721.1 class I SAM-dependent methyltransferase [Nannocystis radixulma]